MQFNLQSSLLTFLDNSKKRNFKKPSSWPDIRKNLISNSIRLLADDRYSLGFTATVTGGYSVNIDGEHYADYNSQEQFSMADWSAYTDTDGYDIDYPTGATKAHIIDIYPQTENANITAFKCTRVAASGTEQQGVLWAHFNIKNYVDLHQSFGSAVQPKIVQSNLTAVTAKNNKLFVNTIYQAFNQCSSLEYVPDFYANTSQMTMNYAFAECNKLVKFVLNNFKIDSSAFTFIGNLALKNLLLKNCSFINAEILLSFMTQAKSLENFTLDVSDATGLTCVGVFGTSSYFMAGFKGLRVSNEAPFNYSTSPQINVSYTGMDRAALVQLFNDLPSVSDSQTLSCVGCTGTADLTNDDKAIATDKGWTLTLQ